MKKNPYANRMQMRLLTLFMKSSSVSKGKLKLNDFIDSKSFCGCRFVHRMPEPTVLEQMK